MLVPYLYCRYTFTVHEIKSLSQHHSCNILSLQSDVPEDSSLVGCYAVLLGAFIFRVKLSHLTLKMKKLWPLETQVTVYPMTQRSNTEEVDRQHPYCFEELSWLCSIQELSGLNLGWVRGSFSLQDNALKQVTNASSWILTHSILFDIIHNVP
jgi:hypothetical protein